MLPIMPFSVLNEIANVIHEKVLQVEDLSKRVVEWKDVVPLANARVGLLARSYLFCKESKMSSLTFTRWVEVVGLRSISRPRRHKHISRH